MYFLFCTSHQVNGSAGYFYLDDIDLQVCLGALCQPVIVPLTCSGNYPTNLFTPSTDTSTFGHGVDATNNCDNGDATYKANNNCCADIGGGDKDTLACSGWVWFAGSDNSK